jgi:hypothetical protein
MVATSKSFNFSYTFSAIVLERQALKTIRCGFEETAYSMLTILSAATFHWFPRPFSKCN